MFYFFSNLFIHTAHHITHHTHTHTHTHTHHMQSSHITHLIPDQLRSAQTRSKSCIFIWKSIHFALHRRVDLKSRFCDLAIRPTIYEGFRWEVLQFLKIEDNSIRVSRGHCHTSHAKSIFFLEIFRPPMYNAYFSSQINLDQRRPGWKGLRFIKVLDGRCCIFWKLRTTLSGFREVTVTPLMQNQYFFGKSSDLPSITFSFHPRSD